MLFACCRRPGPLACSAWQSPSADESRPMDDRRRVVGWFLVGIVVALFLQWTQVVTLGGRWDSLVYVGESGPGRAFIERELPDITLVEQLGHDGQTVYVVARDPFMTDPRAAASLDDAGFRYRRILYPMIAGLAGILGPNGVVVGMIVSSVVAFAVVAAAVAALPRSRTVAFRGAVAVLVVPGLWLSVRTLTVDVIAVAFLVVGVALLLRERWGLAALALTAAALTKEVYLVAGVAAAASVYSPTSRRHAALLGIGPLAVVAAWSGYVQLRVGNGFSPRGNLGPPIVGLTSSVGNWLDTGIGSVGLGIAVIVSLVVGLAIVWRRVPTLSWQLVPWLAIAIVLSNWVWEIPSNAARALVAVWVLAVVAYVTQADDHALP